jgi:uncharacterized protein
MRGVELLREHHIDVSALCVLTSQSVDHPDEIFQFFVENGFRDVAFNVEEIEGPNLESSLLQRSRGLADARRRYRAFMLKIGELNRDCGWPLTIREFLILTQRMAARRSDSTAVPRIPEQRLGEIITMARDGTLFSWSPELASGVPGGPNRFALGNIVDVNSLDELFATPRATAIQTEIDNGVEMCRQDCEYFGVCGGGSPGNKAFENGTFASTQTLKCALQVQELTEVLLTTLGSRETAPHLISGV